MKLAKYLITGSLIGLVGCDSGTQYISYKNVDTSSIEAPDFSRYIIETCVDIYREKQNQNFDPRYSVISIAQTGKNNVLEIKMMEVRYVKGSRQEQNRFLYCSRFDKEGTDTIFSHLYLDTFTKYLEGKKYSTYPIDL
ncbi:hypothetical protein [Pseudoalteromonas sp. GW168-MNA-CIBAN-0100]|uniref:hypothetical protein n=1 Tax=Pseudoalteromonas sp. GW168-MNA-CIBAN-0100 TaxID=3140434 RepID=UPI0033242DD2